MAMIRKPRISNPTTIGTAIIHGAMLVEQPTRGREGECIRSTTKQGYWDSVDAGNVEPSHINGYNHSTLPPPPHTRNTHTHDHGGAALVVKLPHSRVGELDTRITAVPSSLGFT